MEEKIVHIPAISCGHCVMTIKNEIQDLEGVNSVEGTESDKMMTFKWDTPATWEKISETLDEIGYPAD